MQICYAAVLRHFFKNVYPYSALRTVPNEQNAQLHGYLLSDKFQKLDVEPRLALSPSRVGAACGEVVREEISYFFYDSNMKKFRPRLKRRRHVHRAEKVWKAKKDDRFCYFLFLLWSWVRSPLCGSQKRSPPP